MNHIENYQFEIYVPKEEREWISWANNVEAHLKHSLDGDLSANGYSLDRAYSWFKLGSSSIEYVREVRSRENYKPHTKVQ